MSICKAASLAAGLSARPAGGGGDDGVHGVRRARASEEEEEEQRAARVVPSLSAASQSVEKKNKICFLSQSGENLEAFMGQNWGEKAARTERTSGT